MQEIAILLTAENWSSAPYRSNVSQKHILRSLVQDLPTVHKELASELFLKRMTPEFTQPWQLPVLGVFALYFLENNYQVQVNPFVC